MWLLEFVFLISGATDEHSAADLPLRPGASAMVSVCVLSRVRDCCARVWLVLKQISIEAELSSWSSFLSSETHEQPIS